MALKKRKTPKLISQSKLKYQVDVENLLKIPANFYWKNLLGIHLGCNDYTAEDTGLSSAKEYIGLSIYDISKKDQAVIIDATDKSVMASAKSNCMIESSGALHGAAGLYLSIKSPLLNDQNKVAGLFGISFKIGDKNIAAMLHSLNTMQVIDGFSVVTNALLKYYTSHDAFHKASLSTREASVLFHFCQGKSAKEIARIFKISPRTVETHIEHIKLKMNCRTKYELIEKFSMLEGILLNTNR